MSSSNSEASVKAPAKRDETMAFLFLSFVLFPILAIVVVGGYGFLLWMQQLLVGPPGS